MKVMDFPPKNINWGGGVGSASCSKIPTFATIPLDCFLHHLYHQGPVVVPMHRITLVCPTPGVVTAVLPDGEVWVEPVLRLSEG